MMETDELLYRRYLCGDEGGLSALMERYGDSLTVFLNGYLHDMQEAEDMMIEAFSRLIMKKPAIGDGCFKAYLFKTGRNLALRAASWLWRRRTVSFEDMPSEPQSEALVEELVHTKERARVLRACMEELAPNYREALYLVYFEGLSHAAAAIVMGKSEKQVADLVYRGKKALKDRLVQKGVNHANE